MYESTMEILQIHFFPIEILKLKNLKFQNNLSFFQISLWNL